MIQKIIAVLAIIAVVISGCATPPLQQNSAPLNLPVPDTEFKPINITVDAILKNVLVVPEYAAAQQKFKSLNEQEYLAFVNHYASRGYCGYYGGWGITDFAMDDLDMRIVPMSAGQTIGSAETVRDHSTTNVQVLGVDEADIVKTDGDYIYALSSQVLFIIKAYPGKDAEKVAALKFEQVPHDLFISDTTLVVIGRDQRGKQGFTPRAVTFVNVYDIEDRSNPKLVKEFHLQGSYWRARMTDNRVYIILQDSLEWRPLAPVEDGTQRVISAENVAVIPEYEYKNPQLVNIHTLDLGDLELSSQSIAAEGAAHLYMSPDNIYILGNEYINEYEIRRDIVRELLTPMLSPKDHMLIQKIADADPEILTPCEKEIKIRALIESYRYHMTDQERIGFDERVENKVKAVMLSYEYRQFTTLAKVALKKSGLEFVASARVPGRITSQFNVDEFNGVVRIATTVDQVWSRWGQTGSSAHVFTFDENLNLLGGISGLAKGEQIYSTRFAGNRLYMVTFRQVDPFFVIDLTNPSSPKLLGELKIPGFSRYLHPYDNDYVIGIGRDATEQGRQQGLKISLFDVRDVLHPKEVAKWVSDDVYSQTNAEWEHKAFLFSREKNLLVIPSYSYTQKYDGAMVFFIDPSRIELKGVVDHAHSPLWYGLEWQRSPVERSLYIEELLYTISKDQLRINRIDDLGDVKRIPLTADTYRVV